MNGLGNVIILFLIVFVILYLRERKIRDNGNNDGFRQNGPTNGYNGGFRQNGPTNGYNGGFRQSGPTDGSRNGFNQSGPNRNTGSLEQNLRYDSRSHRVYMDGNVSSRTYTGSSARSGMDRGPASYNEHKEILEAIEAGEYALSSLRNAERSLQSARGWGMIDIVGGGLISGAVKHSRISEAKRYVEDARSALRSFRNELADISRMQSMDIQIGDFLTVADFFFDGFVADILVQSKISDARNQILNAIREVETMLNRLYAMRG